MEALREDNNFLQIISYLTIPLKTKYHNKHVLDNILISKEHTQTSFSWICWIFYSNKERSAYVGNAQILLTGSVNISYGNYCRYNFLAFT